MKHFLIEWERPSGQLVSIREFDKSRDAIHQRFIAERHHRDHERDVEVVVLTASSRELLLRTHGRYFHTVAESTKILRDSVAEPRRLPRLRPRVASS